MRARVVQVKRKIVKVFKGITPSENKTKQYAYEMGKDCALNGANVTNCNFSIFSSSENTKTWEDGKRDGKKEKMESKQR